MENIVNVYCLHVMSTTKTSVSVTACASRFKNNLTGSVIVVTSLIVLFDIILFKVFDTVIFPIDTVMFCKLCAHHFCMSCGLECESVLLYPVSGFCTEFSVLCFRQFSLVELCNFVCIVLHFQLLFCVVMCEFKYIIWLPSHSIVNDFSELLS